MSEDDKALVNYLRHIRRDGTWISAKPASPHPVCSLAADRIEAQAAEIERLRAALDWIANARQGYTYEAARDAARAALGETE